MNYFNIHEHICTKSLKGIIQACTLQHEDIYVVCKVHTCSIHVCKLEWLNGIRLFSISFRCFLYIFYWVVYLLLRCRSLKVGGETMPFLFNVRGLLFPILPLLYCLQNINHQLRTVDLEVFALEYFLHVYVKLLSCMLNLSCIIFHVFQFRSGRVLLKLFEQWKFLDLWLDSSFPSPAYI